MRGSVLQRYFVLISATEENPTSQRYHVTNGINIFKACMTNSGYMFLRDSQNALNSSDENSDCKVLSAHNSFIYFQLNRCTNVFITCV
jgi:hypothetical protein